ncbi:hypothetical protein O3M35_007702 [Rhynocoris fuscipes]|uniref:Reverse transcriptase zinc-binding domain-containing protein n=1 Tax=Rhynocoris fuscipes TaxID=488301 RepID=A0AAW1DAZ9_9HEMI
MFYISKTIADINDANFCIRYNSFGRLYQNFKSIGPTIRVVSQLRLSCNKQIRIWFKNGGSHSIDSQSICTLCSSNENEDLIHLLLYCHIYGPIRAHYFSELNINENNIHELLTIKSKYHLNKLYFYIIELLKLRAFIVNE